MKIFDPDGKKALIHQRIWECTASNTADAYIVRKNAFIVAKQASGPSRPNPKY
jgi:hypothetical protein